MTCTQLPPYSMITFYPAVCHGIRARTCHSLKQESIVELCLLPNLLETKATRQFQKHGPNINKRLMVPCQIFLKMKVSRSFARRQMCPEGRGSLLWPEYCWSHVLLFERAASGQRDIPMSSQEGHCPRLSLRRLGLGGLFT